MRIVAVRIVAVEKEPAAAACAHTVSGAGGTVGVGVDDRPRALVGCGVCEMSPIMLAAREGSSKLRQRRPRWRRWQGEWHRRIWLYCEHPGNRVVVARYGACQDDEARGNRRWRRTRAARDWASGPRDGIGIASGGLCGEVGARHGCAT